MRLTAARARVLVVGSLNIDLVLRAAAEPLDEGAVAVESAQTLVGGHAGNCASALAALGVSVDVAGAVGQDSDGDLLVRDLSDRGIDVSRVSRHPDLPTGRVVIPVFDDKHYMLLARGANEAFGAHELLKALDGGHDAVMVFDPGLEALQALRRTDALLCWSPGGLYASSRVAEHVVPQADVIFVNRSEYKDLGVAVPGELVVTLGARGSLVRHRGSELAVPARRAAVVDPVGAGDAFAAAYVLARLAGLTAAARLAVGNAGGAAAVEGSGARTALATLVELLGESATN
ncbi:PfkB family carbohydrate kinase [Pseudonocardia sp. TMWB2A]|uniref:PfkB family carbohydrate kinase n=1 Tax=Pseudonocardia sp. TMWB2A TaxID=687430 RepID=UPI00307FCADB